jgi:Tol biopolymer transport system component
LPGFFGNQDGKDELFISSSDGSNLQHLTDQVNSCACSPDALLSWSPDSQWI